MKRILIIVCISLCLALSMALASSSLPIPVNSNHDNDEISLSESNGLSIIKNEYLNPAEIKNRTVGEEIYSQLEFTPYFPLDLSTYKTDRFIVKFKDISGRASLVDSLGEDFKQIRTFNNSNFAYFNVIMTTTKMSREDFMAKAVKNAASEIEYIQPDYQLSLASLDINSTAGQQDVTPDKSDGETGPQSAEERLPEYLQGLPPDDPMVEMWLKNHQAKKEAPKNTADTPTPAGLADINIQAAWEKSRGTGSIVALLDTGVDITHRNLAPSIWTNHAEIPGNSVDDDNNGYIDDTEGWDFTRNNSEIHKQGQEYSEWHGTHLAGIIVGAAPEAKIMPLQVFKNGAAYTSDIIEAIAYAEKNGAKIANCSWGTSSDNPALEEAMENSPILFVCAAGNSNSDIGINPVFPASYRMNNIITVASLNKNDNLSGYSNYGKRTVDAAALGENIISAIPGDRQGTSSGTSQSAAFVTGEAALILGAQKNVVASEIKQVIIESSDQIESLSDKVIGGNKINCYRAVSTDIPESKETSASEDNESISVTDSIYGETTVTWAVYGSPAVWDPVYQDAGQYSLYSGEIWNIKTSMPTERYGLATAKVNGKIYAIGGRGFDGDLNTVEEYDPVSDTWTTKAAMPTPRRFFAAAAVNGKIYAIGGYNNSSGILDTVEEYDPVSNTWTEKAAMPTARELLAATVADDKIYAIGGYGFGVSSSAVEAYDPLTDEWTVKADLPTPRYALAVTAANGTICAIGGYDDNNEVLNTVEAYDPTTDMWTSIADMPTSRCYLAASFIGARIYAVGGFNYSSGYLNAVEELRLAEDDYGDDFSSSTTIDIGATVEGWIDYAYDEDSFNFSPAWSGTYSMESASFIDMWGDLYDSDQILLAYDDDSGVSSNFKITAALQADQTYYLIARNYSYGTGLYRIVISQQPPNFTAASPDSSTITLSWDPVPDAIGYDLEVDGAVIDNGSNTTYIHSGLVSDVTHIYRIRAYYADATGGWSKKAYALTQGSYYQIRSPMPTPRYGLATAVVNGKLYATGGYGENGRLNTVEEYDPATNTWTVKASMPTPRHGLAAAAIDGKIYAVGGISSSMYSNTVEEYDPGTDTWTAKAAMPTPRRYLATAAVNGKIYAIGGYGSSGYLNTLEEYDPATNTWTTKANMPTPRYGLAASEVDGKIYAIGGYSSSGYSNAVEEYDPATDTWTAKAVMPTPRYNLAATAADGKIYAVGGYNNGYLDTAEEYNPATNTWSTESDMPIKCSLPGAVALNGKIYMVGGYNADGYLDYVQEFCPQAPASTNYEYDENNRLRYVELPSGQIIEYQYDAGGNLLRRILLQ